MTQEKKNIWQFWRAEYEQAKRNGFDESDAVLLANQKLDQAFADGRYRFPVMALA